MTSSDGTAQVSPNPKKKTRFVIAAAAVLLLAAIFRFYGLGEIPRGLFRDEAVKGYSAFQLWEAGRQVYLFQDEPFALSPLLPVFMEEGAHFTSAIYQYLCAPFVGLFGLYAPAVRLPAAIAGFLTVAFVLPLMRTLEQFRYAPPERRDVHFHAPPVFTAIAAGVFMALSPTHILFSRWAQQGVTVPLWTTIGLLCLLKVPSVGPKHQRALALSGGFFMAAAFYAYAPARVVVPLILLGLWWEFGTGFRRLVRLFWPAALVFLLIAVPVTVYFLGAGASRFEAVAATGDGSIVQTAWRVLRNYSLHFDPHFLLLSGDANPRHSMPFGGIVAWAEIPFFLVGVLITAIKWKRPGSRLLLIWFLSAPAAAALTNDGLPHGLRSILFFPVVHLISARGAAFIWSFTKGKRARLIPLIAAAVITAGLNIYGLFVIKARDYRSWSFGVLEALQQLEQTNAEGVNVLSAEIPFAPYYVLFHEQTPPELLHEQGFAALQTLVLPPGAPLPDAALVIRPPRPFEQANGDDLVVGEGEAQKLIFKIEQGW